MTHTVALTGATGFVGRHVLPKLLASHHHVRVLVRDRKRLDIDDARVHAVEGDLFNSEALAQLVDSADTVVHLVGIIAEKPHRGQTFERVHHGGTVALLAAARAAGVKRWIHMSALGARPAAVARYHQSKWAAESAVRDSSLDYTIFRPSIIHGPDGEFMQMVKDFCCKMMPPFLPYFGGGVFGRRGAGQLQPIWVEDVADCFVRAIERQQTIGETYPMGGPDVFTWPQLYLTCKAHLPCARARKQPRAVPVWLAKIIAGLPGAPFNEDQIIMSQEDSVCQIGKLRRHFEIDPAPFEDTFAQYAADIG